MDGHLIIIIAKFALLAFSYGISLFLCVFLHELGHSLAAWALTRQQVRLSVGTSDSGLAFGAGRLVVRFSLGGFRYGLTEYDRSIEPRGVQIAVAAMGPIASLLGLAVGFYAIAYIPFRLWWWIPGLAFFVANFRILLVALLPLEYRPRKDSDEVWLSDSLDIWRMLRPQKVEKRNQRGS